MSSAEKACRALKGRDLGPDLLRLPELIQDINAIRSRYGVVPWILIQRNGHIASASSSSVSICMENLAVQQVESFAKLILLSFHPLSQEDPGKREIRLLKRYSLDAVISLPLESGALAKGCGAWLEVRDGRLSGEILHEELDNRSTARMFEDRFFQKREESLKHVRVEFDTQPVSEKAMAVHLAFTQENQRYKGSPREEFLALCDTLGLEILQEASQKLAKPQPRTFLGSGRFEEICESLNSDNFSHCVFNVDVPASVKRRITHETFAQVWDRTDVILQIFQKHARTEKARLQVELAQLEYNGEEELRQALENFDYDKGFDLYEQNWRLQIASRKKEIHRALERTHRQQETRQGSRKESNVLSLAVMGYTNAGKSTLFNSLLGSEEAAAANVLFKTLETTSRTLGLSALSQIVITDTVGFISNLPRHLTEAFHTTLEEARAASHILILLDPLGLPLEDQLRCMEESLTHIGLNNRVDWIVVVNKTDCLAPAQKEKIQETIKPHFFVSALEPESVELLREGLRSLIASTLKTVEIELSHADYGKLHQLKAWATLPKEPEYLPECIRVELAFSSENQHHIERVLGIVL